MKGASILWRAVCVLWLNLFYGENEILDREVINITAIPSLVYYLYVPSPASLVLLQKEFNNINLNK